LSSLRRGFKTWCENAAAGYRRSLNLARNSALDPRLLAQHLNVIVWKTTEVPGLDPTVLNHLTKVDPESWSAVTLRLPEANLIVTNETHVIGRQNNSLTHEMSHIILRHEPAQVFVNADGLMMMTHYNKTHEDEADCLAGTLLVPREALMHLLDEGYDNRALSKYFEVTPDLIRMRRNLTGVDIQRSRRGSRRANS
jgi:Zn-dependent peptidase ImmA (M78 family)